MIRAVRSLVAPISLALIALASQLPSTPATAQQAQQSGQKTAQQPPKEIVKATYGRWQVVCIKGKDGDHCVMRQFGQTADGKKVLEVQIQKLKGIKTKDGKPVPAAIQITTPLGTLLRRGVSVKVDKGQPRTGLFEVCLPNGCILRDPVSAEFLGQLKAGSAAKMTFAALRRGEITVSISLKGFTKAYNKL